MDYIRASRETRQTLNIRDPRPVDSVQNMWQSIGLAATIGIFLLMFGIFLYVGRSILLPVFAAAIVAMTFAPLVRRATRHGIPPWITALLIVIVAFGALGIVAMAMAGPVSEWISRAPEIGATIKERLSVLDRPLASLHELENTLFGGSAAFREFFVAEHGVAGGRLPYPRRR